LKQFINFTARNRLRVFIIVLSALTAIFRQRYFSFVIDAVKQ
jgi:hypothetical protein